MQAQRKVLMVYTPSLQVPDEFGIPVDRADNQNRKEKIIGEILQQVFILNSPIIPFDGIMNVSENVIGHSKRYNPMIVNRKEKLCSGDQQY